MGSSSVTRLSAATSIDLIAEEMARSGVVIVEDFLSTETLRGFAIDIEPYLAAQKTDRQFMNPTVAGFFGTKTHHLTGLAAKSPTFVRDVLCHHIYSGIGDRFLKPQCTSFQLNLGHIIERGPGAEPQLLHRDDGGWPARSVEAGERLFSSMTALGDYTEIMGATVVVPGSHTWDRDRVAAPDEIVPAVMNPGSAVIYLGSTLHAAGANRTTGRWRRGMHVSFCLGWLRTEENQYLSTPMETVRTMSRQAQLLLGFGAHDLIEQGGGYLGSVDLRDPLDLIATGEL